MVSFDLNNKHFTKWLLKYDGKHRARLISKVQSQLSRMGVTGESMKKALLQLSQQTNVHLQRLTAKEIKMYERDSDYNGWNRKNPKWHRILTSSYSDLCDYDYDQTFYSGSHNSVSYAEPHPASSSRSWSSDTRGEEVLHWNSTDPGEQHRSSERYYNEVCNEREFYHDQPSGFSNKDDYGYYRKKRKWGCDSVDSADYRATKNYEERRTSCEENITYHEYDNYRDRSRNFGKGRGRTFNKYSRNERRQWEMERNSIQKGDSSLSSEKSIKKEQVSDVLFQVDENHSSACSNKMNTKHSVTKESKLSLAEINNKPSLGKLQKSKIDVNVKQANKNRMDKLPTKKFKKKNHIEEKEEMPRISVIVNGKACKSAKADEKRKTEVTVPVKQTNLNVVRKKVQSSVVPEPLHCTSTSLTKSDNYHSAKSDSNKNTNASEKAEEGANVQATKKMKESDDSKSRKVSDDIPQPIAVKSKNSVPDKDDFPKSFKEVTESTKKTNQKVNVLQGSEKTINVTSDKDASSDVKRNKQIGSLSEQSLSVKAECGIEISKPSKDAAVSEPKVLDRAQKPANVKASHGREKLQTDSVLSLEGATVKKVSCDKMCTMPKKVDSEGLPSVDRRSKDSVNVCEKSVDIKTKDSSEVHKKLKDSTPRSKISDRTDRPQKGSSKVCESSVAVKIKSDSAVATLSKESNTLKPKINDKTEKPKQDSNSICEPSVATKTKDDIEVCKVLKETSTPKVKNSDRIDKPKQDTQMFQVTDKTQDSQVGEKAVDGNVCCDTKGSKDTDKLCDHVPIKMQDGDNVPKSLKEGSKPKQVVSAEKIKEEATMSQATRETVSTLSSGRRLSHEEKRKKDCDNVQGQLFAVKTESRDRETFKDTSISDKQLIINRNEKSKENINISQATDTGVSALSSEKVTSKVECCYDKREKSKDPGSVHDQMQGSFHARTKDEVLETLKEKSLSKPLTNIETEKMKESSFEMQAREKTVSGLASENLTNKVVCYNEEHNKDTGDREQSLAGVAKNREEVTKTSDPSKPVISVAGEKPKENLCVLQVIEKHVNIQDAACEGENRKGTDCNTSEECVASRNEIEDSSTSKESNPSMEVIHTDFVTKVDGLQTDNAALNIGSDESCAKKMDDNFILEYIGGEYVGEELVCGHFTIEIETTEHEIDREDGSFYVNDNSNISREKPEVSRGLSSNTAEEFDRRKHSLIQYPMMDRKNEKSSSQQVTSSSGPQNGFAQSSKKCVKENEISSHSKLHRSHDDSSAEQILHTVPIQRAKNFELKEKSASEKFKRIEQLKSFSQHTVNHRSRTPSILFQPGEVKDLSKVRTTKRECYTTVAEYYNQTNLEPDSKVKETENTEKIKVPGMAKNVEGKVRHGNLHLATNQNKFPLKTTENSDDIIKSNILSIKKTPSHNIAKKPGDTTTNKKLTKETLVHSTINTSNDGSKCKTKEVPIKITPEKSDNTFKIKTVPVKEVPSLVHSTINTSNDGSKCKTKEVPIKITPEKSVNTFKIKTVPVKEVPSQHNNVKSGHEMNKIMLAKKSSHPFKTKSVSETEILVQTSNTETSEICTVRVGTELKNRIASILNSHYKGKPLKNIKRRSSEPASSGTSKIHKKRRFSYDGDDAASCRILLEKSLYQKKDTAETTLLENKNVCKKNENKIEKEGTNSFTNKPKEADKLKLKEEYRTSTDIVVGSKSTVPKVKKKFSKSKRMLELFGEDPEEPARKSSKCPGEMKTSAAYNASTDALGKVLSHAEKTLAVDSCRNIQKDQHSQHKDSKIDQPVLTVEITDPTRQGNLSEKLIINDRNLDIVFPSPQVQVDGTLQLHSVNTDNFINPVNVPNKGILNSLKQASVVSVTESVSSLTTVGSTATERREHEGTITKDIHGKNVKASVVNVNEHVSSLTTVGSTATECREHEEIHGKSVNKLGEDEHTKSSGGIVLEQKQLDKSSAQSETINEGGHLAGGRMPLKHSALSSCPQVNAKNQDESGPGKIVADSIQNFESVYIKVKVDDVEDGSTPVDTSGAEEKSKDQQQSVLSSQGGTAQSDHLHLSTVANTSLSDSVSGSSNNTGGNDKVAQQPTTSTPIHSAPSDSLSFGNSTVENCHVPQQSLLITEGNPANESHSNSSEILRPERTAISCESSNVHSNKTSNSDISSKPSSGQRIRVRDLSSMMKSSYSSLQHPEISNHPSNMQRLDIPSSRTQPTNTVVSSEQDLSYLNILQQPETVVQPNSVQQPEIAVQSNGVQQTHVVVHSNNVQQTQVAVHPNTVQQTQVVVHSSSVEQPEVAVHSNNVQQPKVTVHSNSVQQSEVVVQSNNVQQPEVVIQSNSVHQPDVVQSNSVQQREVVGFNTLRQPELGSQHNVNMQIRPESFSFELMDMKLNRLVEIIYMIQKHIDRCMEDFKSLEHVEVAEEVKVRERHFSRSVLCKYVEVTLRDFLELRAYITNFLKEHADGIILERLNKLPIANNVPFSQEKLTQCYNICESVRRSIQKAFHLNKQQVAQNNAVPHHQSVTIPNSSSGGQSASCQSSTVPYAPHSHSNILLSEGSSDVHLRDTAQRSQIVGQVSHQSQANGNTSLPVGPVQFPQQSQTSSEPVHSSQIPHQRRASNTSVPVGSRQIAHQSQGNYNTSMPVTQQPRTMIHHVPLMNNDSSSHSQFPPSYNQHMRQTASGLNVNYPMNSSQALQYDNNGNRNINMHNQQMYRRQQSLPTHMSGRPVYPYSNYMPSSMPASNGAAHSQWNLVSQNGNHLRQLGHSTRQMIPNPANNRENNSASNYEGPVSALGHPQNRDLMHHLGNSARHTVPNLTSNTGNASVPNYGGQVSTFAHPQNRNPVSQLSHSSGQSIPSSSRNAGNNPSPNTDGTFSGYGHTQNRNPVPHLGHLNRQTVPNSGNTGNGSAANFVAPGSVYGHSQNRNQVSDLGRSTRQAISNSANNTGNNSCDGPVPTFQGTLNSTMSTYPFPVNHSVNNCSRAVVQGSEQVTPHLREMLTSQVHPHSTRNNSESMARPSGPPQPPPSQPLSGQLQFLHSGGSYSQQQTHVQRRSLPDPSCFDNRSSEHQNQVLQQVSQSHQTSTVSSNTQAHDAQVHGKPQTISHRRMSVERRVPHENSSESNTNKEKSQSRPPPLTNIPNVTTMQSLVNNTNYQPVASALSTFCQVYANFVVEQRQQKEKFGSPHQKVTNACSDTQVPGASVNRNHWNGNRVPNMVMNTQELVSPVGGNQVLQIQQYQLDKNQGVQSTTVNSQPPISVANNESSNNQNGHSYVNSAQIQNIPNSQRPLGAVYTNQISHSQNTPYAHVREQNASLNGRINSNQTCLNQNQQQPNIQGHCQLTDLRYQNVPVNMQMQGSEVGNNQSDNVSHIQKQLSRYQMLQNALVNSHTSIAAPDGTREGQMLQQCHADNPREVAESASSVNDGSEVSSVNQQVGQQSAQNMSERETSRITVTLQNKSQESGKRMSQPDSIGSKHGTAAHTEPRHKSSDNILSDAHSSRTTTFVGRLESVNSNEVHELTVSNKSQHHPFVSSQKTASTTAEVVERRNSQQETNEISSRVPSRQSELNVPRAEERPSLVNTSESTGESDSDIEVIHEVVVLEPRTVSRDSGYTTPSPMVGQIPVKDDQEDAPGGKMFNCEPVEEQKMCKMLEDEDYVKEMQPADEEPEDDKLTIWFEREDTMPLWRESESEGNFQAWHELEVGALPFFHAFSDYNSSSPDRMIYDGDPPS